MKDITLTKETELIFLNFHDGGRYYIETSPLISANQWTGVYMITASVMKRLMKIIWRIQF